MDCMRRKQLNWCTLYRECLNRCTPFLDVSQFFALWYDLYILSLQDYLRAHLYSTVVTQDFLNAMQPHTGEGMNITTIMKPWLYQMGLPVVNITDIGNGQLKMTQTRFMANPNDDPSLPESPYQYVNIFLSDWRPMSSSFFLLTRLVIWHICGPCRDRRLLPKRLRSLSEVDGGNISTTVTIRNCCRSVHLHLLLWHFPIFISF